MKVSSKDKIINASQQQKLNKARELFADKKYQQAIQMYGKVIFLKENVSAIIELAEIYKCLMDTPTSLLFYKRAQQISENSKAQHKIQNISLTKGLRLISIGSCKNILLDTQFESFSQKYPNFHKKMVTIATKQSSPRYLQRSAQSLLSCLAYLEMNQRGLALNCLNKCISQEQNPVDLLVLKVFLCWSLGSRKQGYQCFWQAYKLQPNNQQVRSFLQSVTPQVQQLYKQAKYDLISEDYTRCRLKTQKALQMYPHHTQFLILSSFLHRKKQEYQQALNQLQHANRTLDKSQSHMQEQLRKQISLTYNEMGVYLYKHRKFQQAIKLFSQGLSYKPKDWGMFCNRGDCYKSVNDLVRALDDYQRAYQIEKGNAELNFRIASVHNLRGIALFNSKNYDHSLREFNQSIKFSPQCVSFYLSKAKCCFQLNLLNEASQSLKVAAKLQPNSTEVAQLMSNLQQQNNKKMGKRRNVIVLNKQK